MWVIIRKCGLENPERLRLCGSKTRCFCPSETKATRIKASVSSPSERNHARSAFLTVFSPYSLRQAREPDSVGRRVCLSRASYAAGWSERMENGVKNLIGSEAVSQNPLKKRQIKTQVLQVWPHSFCWPLPCKNNIIGMGFRRFWLS